MINSTRISLMNSILEELPGASLTHADLNPGSNLQFFSNLEKGSEPTGWISIPLDGKSATFGCHTDNSTKEWLADPRDNLNDRSTFFAKVLIESKEKTQRTIDTMCILKAEKEAPLDHPYLNRKSINPYGVKVFSYWNDLIVKICDIEGCIHGHQLITAGGSARFAGGTVLRGNFFPIAQPKNRHLRKAYVCCSFAEGAKLREKTRTPVFCALAEWNKEYVAAALRAKYPNASITITKKEGL